MAQETDEALIARERAEEDAWWAQTCLYAQMTEEELGEAEALDDLEYDAKSDPTVDFAAISKYARESRSRLNRNVIVRSRRRTPTLVRLPPSRPMTRSRSPRIQRRRVTANARRGPPSQGKDPEPSPHRGRFVAGVAA